MFVLHFGGSVYVLYFKGVNLLQSIHTKKSSKRV